jgi:hypothetical protein
LLTARFAQFFPADSCKHSAPELAADPRSFEAHQEAASSHGEIDFPRAANALFDQGQQT